MRSSSKTASTLIVRFVAMILPMVPVVAGGSRADDTPRVLETGGAAAEFAAGTGGIPSAISRLQPEQEFELRIHTAARYRIETSGTTQLRLDLSTKSSTPVDLEGGRGRRYSPDLVNQVIDCELSPGTYRLRVTHARPGGIGEFRIRSTRIDSMSNGSREMMRSPGEGTTSPQFVAQLGHLGTINDAALSADGRLLVTGGVDYVAVLWDVESRREIRRFFGHTASVNAVDVSADGRCLVTASDDGTACIWDASDGKLLRAFPSFPKSRPVRFSPDGQRICFLDSDGGSGPSQLRCFAVATGQEGPSLRLGESRARCFAFASGVADNVYVAHADGRVRVWELRSEKTLGEPAGIVENADMMAVSADGSAILAGTKAGQVRLWPDHRQGGSTELDLTGGTPRTLIGLRLASTGAFAIASEDRRTSIWRIREGQRPGGSSPPEFAGRALSATACAFTPDGQELRTMTTTITRQTPWPWELKEPRIWRWSPRDGTLLGTWADIPGLSADGRPIPEIEAGHFAGAIDPQGKPLGLFGGLGGAVGLKNAYAVSSDGRLVAACDTVNRVGLN